MKNTITYTSTLSAEVAETLGEYSRKLRLPKNKIIEDALTSYLENLKREEYARSFRRAAQDEEMQELAEQGLVDYLKMTE